MKQAPYGTWHSALAAADLARSAISLNYVQIVAGVPYWVESRPSEGGRSVIVTAGKDGSVQEVTPQGFNVRTRVHEYGGGAWKLRRRPPRAIAAAAGSASRRWPPTARSGGSRAAPPRLAKARPQNRPWFVIPAEAGNVVLFESWLRHEVPPNPVVAERISISFNYNWF